MAMNLVDRTALDAALTATADAIRAKTGSSAELTFDLDGEKGFEAAVENSGLVKPTGNIQLTQQSGTDVTDKATASVRSGSLALNTPSVNSSTGVVTASASLSTSGWIGSAPSSKTLQLTTQAGKTVTPGTSQQTAVASGRYTTGAVYVAGDADLVASNIKSGVDIFGVTGTYEGSGGTLIEKTITQNGTYNASDDSADGYNKVTVAVSGGGGGGAGIYGAEWSGSSDPSWTRTDDAANFADPVPYVAGAANYGSPFDNIMPWAGMQIVEDAEAGTLVSVPKFWYKLSGGGGSPLKIQIANHAESGFSVSPMHMDRGDGKGERGIAFIGRYHSATSTYKSTTGATPANAITRATARSGIHALGNNVWQGDFAMRFTIWLLYLVEFADWGSQWVIGAGCGDGTPGVKAMGYTDSMPYHTGTNLSSKRTFGYGTQYRYIEGLWDNCYDWLDGCYYNSNGLNLIKNPASFSDSSGGTLAGLPVSGIPKVMSVSTSGGYPVFYPTTTGGSTEGSTGAGGSITGEGSYVPDYWYFFSSGPCLFAGGYLFGDPGSGLFCVVCDSASSANVRLGCRLQKLP